MMPGPSVLSVTVAYVQGDAEYLELVESVIHRVAKKYRGVRPAISSSTDSPDRAAETISLLVEDTRQVDKVAAAVVVALRKVGLKKGYVFSLERSDSGSDAIYIRRVFESRETEWKPKDAVKQRFAAETTLPERIHYLHDLVEKYYLAAGNDAYALLSKEGQPEQFVANLSNDDRRRLVDAYLRIVDGGDHLWINKWVADDDGKKVSMERVKSIYFLAMLDRLVDGGLLEGFKRSRKVRLIEWDRFV